MRSFKVAIVGFGSVGQGVAKVIASRNGIFDEAHAEFKIVAITDSKGAVLDPKGIDISSALKQKREGTLKRVSMSSLDVVKNVDYDILVEVTPTDARTGEPGLSYIIEALSRGKHVVTSNKGPLANQYKMLLGLSKENNVKLLFEATAGGAMPVFNLARTPLAGNKIKSIMGIFNGTCNYILTRMITEELPYDMVLSEAKELGYAEADPTYDVEGIDTALKLVILANAVFGMDVKLDDVDIVGISSITLDALKLASDDGYVVKLIGEVRPNGEESILRVSPRLVPKTHPLAVQGTLNAALMQTELAGDIMVIGKGAGSIETASAILSDMMYIASSKD
ncbi:homoserine dehydrogenase [Methanocella sp. CWC-04]|uniref:Homoserine dehydrogenase n=1 Tax=Methanooceanicella nereidis TaxID=2052831 RepID=A0AAP2RBL7_9EURY|nr:homoserine dehydrogenase [Methanocella sp. CWC-04]MCD1293916.1 homoserine dehydrogenase [Methanocella sp. CWC-04]